VNSIKQLPPYWWKHSSFAWNDINNFFTSSECSCDTKDKDSEEHFNEDNWLPISTGRSNASYRFSVNQCKLFIQITNWSNTQFLPYEKVSSLEETLSTDEYVTLSPWLVDTFFQSKEVRIQEWFESESLDLSLNRNKNIIEMLAKSLANLHQIESTELPSFDLERHLIRYQKIALSKEKNSGLKREINICLNNAILTLQTYKPSSLCHYDLNLHNILLNKNKLKIKIVDWEYVCMGDPVLDVTAIINNFELKKESEEYFISSYRQHFNRSTKIDLSNKKLSDMKLLNLYILQLWEYGQ